MRAVVRSSGMMFLGGVAALILCTATAAAADRVYPDAEAVEPLQPGSPVPSVTVHDVGGQPVDLSHLVRETGALLIFYRGGW